MQYLIHDIIKLPLADRLELIEQVICLMKNDYAEQEILALLAKQVKTIVHK